MNAGDLIFVDNEAWDIWFHADDIGRVYEADFVEECTPVIVTKVFKEPELERSQRFLDVHEVISNQRMFWIARKYR